MNSLFITIRSGLFFAALGLFLWESVYAQAQGSPAPVAEEPAAISESPPAEDAPAESPAAAEVESAAEPSPSETPDVALPESAPANKDSERELSEARPVRSDGSPSSKLIKAEPAAEEKDDHQPAVSRQNVAPPRRSAIPAPPPIPRRPESALQMLGFFNIDESVLRQFTDRRDLDDAELEPLNNILYAIAKFPPEEIARWTEKENDWNALIEAPEQFRTKIFELTGRVLRVEKVSLIPEAAERFEFGHYYRCEVELGEDNWKAIVFARQIPKAWKLDTPMNETVSCRGMFVKLGSQPYFVTSRLAWHPNRADAELHVTKDEIFLGDLGMDVGLLDQVKDRRSLLPEDRDGFYELLAAVGRTNLEHLNDRATTDFSFPDLLRYPEKFRGKLLNIKGTARRAAKIIVNDRDIRERLGIDHYYEIYIFVRLEKKIVFTKGDKELQYSTFPLVFCARELPPDMPEGDSIHTNVSVTGYYFKLWTFESVRMSQFDESQRQPCPMLIGLSPEVIPTEKYGMSALTGWLIGGGIIASLLIITLYVGIQGRGDAKFHREKLAKNYELDAGKSLNEMGLEAKGAPDFSNLE